MTRVIDSPIFWWALMVGAPAYIWLISTYIVLVRRERMVRQLREMDASVDRLLETFLREGPAAVEDLSGRVVCLDSRRRREGLS